jgi:uncharacterized damage-inducible protein DinB
MTSTNLTTVIENSGTSSFPNGRWLPAVPTTAEPVLTCQPSDEGRRILDAAVAILLQGEDLLRSLTSENYARKVPLVFNASIGGHYRHCLDHFTSLWRGLDRDEVNYDHRARDARLEAQPSFALAQTRHLRGMLEQLSPETLDTSVRARCEVSYAHGQSPAARSTLGRELVYVIAHAIHHYALISVMARLLEVKLPDHFGVAPSTVAHQAATQAS